MVLVGVCHQKRVLKRHQSVLVDSQVFLDVHRRVLSDQNVLRLFSAHQCHHQRHVPCQ